MSSPTYQKIPIKELIDPKRGLTYGIVQPGDYHPNGAIMIRSQDYVKGWNSLTDLFRVSPDVEAPYMRSRVQAGDILIKTDQEPAIKVLVKGIADERMQGKTAVEESPYRIGQSIRLV